MLFKVGDLAKFKDDAYEESAIGYGFEVSKTIVRMPVQNINGGLVEIVAHTNEQHTHGIVLLVAFNATRHIALRRIEPL